MQQDSYLSFCKLMDYIPVPATEDTLCKYAVYLSGRLCYTSIKQYFTIIKHMHSQLGFNYIGDKNYKLGCLFRGLRRTLGDKSKPKEPVTPSILVKFLSQLRMDTISDTAIWSAALIAFFALLRRSNVVGLRRSDIKFVPDGLEIELRWTKTIQFSERSLIIPIPRIPGSPLCPYQATMLHFRKTPFVLPTGPAFVTNLTSTGLSANLFISSLKTALAKYGYDQSQYSGHSYRRGGASFLYQCGVPLHTIQQLGDWHSDAYQRYVFDNRQSISFQMQKVLKSIQNLCV